MQMTANNHPRLAFAGIVAGKRRFWSPRLLSTLGAWAVSGLVWANTEAAGGASTGPDLSGVGRALGTMLFAYLALRWFNRQEDRDADQPRGVLGRPVKLWVVVLVLMVVLMLLPMLMS